MSKKAIIISAIAVVLGVVLIACCVAIPYFNNNKKDSERAELVRQYRESKLAQFEEENKTLSGVQIAFVGDSLTDGYDVGRFFPQYTTTNRGIGGDRTFDVEDRLKVSVYDVNPQVVTLLIGANNINTMFDNYETILQKLKQNVPSSKIVLLSLTAMSGNWGKKNETAILNNQKIKLLAKKYDYTFVDLFTPLCNPETNELYEEYTVDGGHLTEKGYQVVTNTLTPVFESLLN